MILSAANPPSIRALPLRLAAFDPPLDPRKSAGVQNPEGRSSFPASSSRGRSHTSNVSVSYGRVLWPTGPGNRIMDASRWVLRITEHQGLKEQDLDSRLAQSQRCTLSHCGRRASVIPESRANVRLDLMRRINSIIHNNSTGRSNKIISYPN